MKPKNGPKDPDASRRWLSPSARQELRELQGAVPGSLGGRKLRQVRAWQWELYAAAHEALPQLLDEVERLEAENQTLNNAWEACSRVERSFAEELYRLKTSHEALRVSVVDIFGEHGQKLLDILEKT